MRGLFFRGAHPALFNQEQATLLPDLPKGPGRTHISDRIVSLPGHDLIKQVVPIAVFCLRSAQQMQTRNETGVRRASLS